MQIVVAKRAGFCFGVKRALDMAFNVARESKEGVFTFGPIIHNPHVIEELSQKGVKAIDVVDSPEIKVLIIRTHGVSPGIYEETQKRGYKVIDATCPFVKKAQHYAKALKDEGYKILILGDRNHPEVQGLLGFAGDDTIIIGGDEAIPHLEERVGIIVQTTQSLDTLKRIVCHLLGSAREIKVYNTICDSTALRLEETKELAKAVDLMLVIGGKNSANTTQLARLCRELGVKIYHIETAEELDNGWFNEVEKVGITGGASTPQWIIDDVIKKLKEISLRR
ncbi:MAG TPA: 4-hydroxy-3-methylbut-2-enyl diphosphate reductase [Nitrospiraceae bacterium]|nr:4-hydroxy-3-methylbut-2-enyl diphosphate reductase [Nitrospiraceae bacterium]